MSELEDGLRDLMAAGLPPPDEVGYELEQAGEVVAEAEMVWMRRKVALLMPAHLDRLPAWEASGWKAVAANGEWKRLLAEELGNRSALKRMFSKRS
jgi:DEAD/DEAH box helicase domain-containing protein